MLKIKKLFLIFVSFLCLCFSAFASDGIIEISVPDCDLTCHDYKYYIATVSQTINKETRYTYRWFTHDKLSYKYDSSNNVVGYKLSFCHTRTITYSSDGLTVSDTGWEETSSTINMNFTGNHNYKTNSPIMDSIYKATSSDDLPILVGESDVPGFVPDDSTGEELPPTSAPVVVDWGDFISLVATNTKTIVTVGCLVLSLIISSNLLLRLYHFLKS